MSYNNKKMVKLWYIQTVEWQVANQKYFLLRTNKNM